METTRWCSTLFFFLDSMVGIKWKDTPAKLPNSSTRDLSGRAPGFSGQQGACFLLLSLLGGKVGLGLFTSAAHCLIKENVEVAFFWTAEVRTEGWHWIPASQCLVCVCEGEMRRMASSFALWCGRSRAETIPPSSDHNPWTSSAQKETGNIYIFSIFSLVRNQV